MGNGLLFNSIAIAFIWLYGVGNINAQTDSDLFALWPDTTLAKANSAIDVTYMNEEEKQVVFYINLCRINPKVFSETYLQDFIKDNDIKKDRDVKELYKVLENTDSKKILEPSELLTSAARTHAKDMGETGRTGHNASDGTPFQKRMMAVSESYSGINENANYGTEKALDIVVDLLIDKNVPSKGHRKNILNTDSRYIGVAIEPHKRYGVNCVQNFASNKIGD
jgi:hypothetical protein